MRFLSIHFPFLATDRIRRAEAPEGSNATPLATWRKAGNAQILVSADAAAQKRGLHSGMAIAVARGICPELRLVESNFHAEAALLGSIADWCRRFTPLAALDAPGSVILDVSGAAHLFATENLTGEEGLLREAETRLARQGFATRLSIAPNAAAASAFARFGGPRAIATDAQLEKAARDLPVTALTLDPAQIAGLRDAGLRRVGDLVLRPRAPIAARFGADVFARIDAIRGLQHAPISPRFEAPPYMAEKRFPEGLARRDDLMAVLGGLASDLCAMLETHDEGARLISASFFRVDGAVRHVDAGTSRPLRDPASFARLLGERLDAIGEDGLDTGYGFDVIRLAALSVEKQPRIQDRMQDKWAAAFAPDAQTAQDNGSFSDLADRLGARLGARRVLRIESQDTHIPEFAAVAMPAAHFRCPAEKGRDLRETQMQPRPARLFERPEAIHAIAAVPDGPPLKFRWRRVMHDVAAVEGPERIAAEWWKDNGPTRDYFRVEDTEGGRFWLFREGLFGHETPHPRWFVHGMF